MSTKMASEPGGLEPTIMTKSKKRPPDSQDGNYGNGDPDLRQCWVCGENSSTYHYGVVACDGCKSFFSRSQSLYKTYRCASKECVVNKFTRNQCQFCRWVKCQAVGMSKEACKLGRRSKKLKAAMKEKSLKLQTLENSEHETLGVLKKKPLVSQAKTPEVVNVVHPFRIETKDSDTLQRPIKAEFTPTDSSNKTSLTEETASPGQPICKEEKQELPPCVQEESTEGRVEATESRDEEVRTVETPEPEPEPEVPRETCVKPADTPAEAIVGKQVIDSGDTNMMEGLTVQELVDWLEQSQYQSFVKQHLQEQERFLKEKWKMKKMGKLQQQENNLSNVSFQNAKPPLPTYTCFGHPSYKIEGLTPTKTWQYISQSFTTLIEGVVTFAKHLPGFKEFDMEDRMTIIKAGCFEAVLVRLSMLHHLPANTMTFFGTDMAMTVEDAQKTAMGGFVTGMFEFCRRINSLELKDSEKALLSAITLMSADRPGLKNKELVSSMQEMFLQALQYELIKNHKEDETLLSQVLLLLPKLREINFEHNKKLMEMKINQDIKFPLLHEEVFDT